MLKKIAITLLLTAMVFSTNVGGQPLHKAQAAGATTTKVQTADQLYPIEVDGKYGFINGKGKIVIEAVYDEVGYSGVNGGTVYVEDHAAKKQYYFSSAGSKLFEYKLRDAGILYNDRALYMKQAQIAGGVKVTRYGYIDSQGKVAIQPVYTRAFNFSEGLASVNMGKASGYINKKGELVIPYRYSSTSDFSESMAAVMLAFGGKYGYIDTTGKLRVPPRYDYATPFSDGAAVVSENGKYGYIDKNGKYLIKPQFSMAQPFSEGLAFVERNGATFYINKKGVKVIQGFTAGGLFKGGLAPASPGQRYGYINTSGRFVIKPQLYWADAFNGELAVISLLVPNSREEIRGYMNRSGTIVWPPASELPGGVTKLP
ncbi:WG repeat-containing protein [Paenibacillus tritici]|uniref:WG repeat-containing protein n=1 Tax=Paenibacillus tritici TaxID=1873425 RepID=A0ABX2E024_9BACL|nr:WG repeat-containing protein [Paenibacillus tritici]NQX49531.1 WG repeat-containing protein [Paenibacillus tritici]